MSKKRKIIGTCALCGKYGQLTFEHVPPHSAFNDKRVITYSGDNLLKVIGSKERPWEKPKIKGEIQQKGRGGFYLCSECNEHTGSWYVPYYSSFIRAVNSTLSSIDIDAFNAVIMQAPELRPLPIFKEIMVMFCDINPDYPDNELRRFLTTKTHNKGFDAKKYRVFCFIAKGPVTRSNGFSALVNIHVSPPCVLMLSEIISYPLGFALYLDLPEGFTPQGAEITGFANYDYDEVVDCTLELPILETNTYFSGDYRSKEEIEKTIKESEAFEKLHPELFGNDTSGR